MTKEERNLFRVSPNIGPEGAETHTIEHSDLVTLLDEADRLEADLARARAENERLVTALRYYADESGYKADLKYIGCGEYITDTGEIVDDAGDVARAALATTTEDKST